MMKMYEFILKFRLPDASVSPDVYIELLGESGCADALIGVGTTGSLALNFARESSSALEAISSAIANVKKAIPEAKLVEATPDLVGLSDIAAILGCSRQNIRKIMVKNGLEFPVPMHEGKSALWHLSKVLVWLKNHKSYDVECSLLDVAATNMQLNMARDSVEVNLKMREKILPLVS